MEDNNIKLCKLLGIEPKITFWDNRFEGIEIISPIALEMIPTKFIDKKEFYPDLSSPSNFVKLIELQVSKKLTVGRYLQGSGNYKVPFSTQWYDRESFFVIMIDYLSRTGKCFARKKNQIIYKAQQTKWEV